MDFQSSLRKPKTFFLALGRKHYFFRGWKKKIPASLKKFSPVWKNSRLSEKVSRVEKNSRESKKFAQIEKIQNFLWVEKIQASQKIVKINKTAPWFLHPPK